MLYASHYCHTGLELKFLVEDSAPARRTRVFLDEPQSEPLRCLTGLFGGIVRSKGQSEARKSLAAALGAARDVLERHARAASSPVGQR